MSLTSSLGLLQGSWRGKLTDDYAKDGGSEDVRLLFSFYRDPLRTSIKISVDKFAISHHMALKLSIRALRKYLKLPYKY